GIRDFHVTGVQTCALPICRDAEIGRKRSVFYFLPQRLCERSSVSSYLGELREIIFTLLGEKGVHLRGEFRDVVFVVLACRGTRRSEERRVGKECESRRTRY